MTEQSSQSTMKIRCPACQRKLDVSELAPLSLFTCPHCAAELRVPKWYQSILLEDIVHDEADLHVYRALDTTLDRETCVKVVDLSRRFGEQQLSAFLGVTRRLATIGHPQVVSVYACGRSDDGAVYAVQQYIYAMSYSSVKARMKPALLLRYAAGILGALMAADAAGISHGGLGPGNILFDRDGNVRVTDFGVARALGKDARTDPYASPELRCGAGATRASDIYSLAVVLYELAAGWRPAEVAGGQEGAASLQLRHLGYSRAFGDCLERMLSACPTARPGSYLEVLKALEAKTQVDVRKGGRFWGDVPVGIGPVPTQDGGETTGVAAEQPKRRRVGYLVNVLLMIAFVALCALFVVYHVRRRATTRPVPRVKTSRGGTMPVTTVTAMGRITRLDPVVRASRPLLAALDYVPTRQGRQ